MTALLLLVGGLFAAFLYKLIGDLLVKEAQGRLDGIPRLILRIARCRLPVEKRAWYDESWLPELIHIQAEHQDRPITRLVLGIRFASGLMLAARRTARAASTEDDRRSRRMRGLELGYRCLSYFMVFDAAWAFGRATVEIQLGNALLGWAMGTAALALSITGPIAVRRYSAPFQTLIHASRPAPVIVTPPS